MNAVNIVINVVLILLTAAVVVLAKQTVSESRKATNAIRDTVTESRKAATAASETVAAMERLLEVARETAASTASSVDAARQSVMAAEELGASAKRTIEVARAAHAADEHDRKVRQLRDIGALAEALFWKAARESGWQSQTGGWRVMEHNYLQQALVGFEDKLPKCVALTQANLADTAMGAAAAARIEVRQALQSLTQQQPIGST